MNKLGISDLDLKGRRVFMRVDFNVPLADGQITDDTRIQAALPSIRYVIEKNGKLILASHLGRPKGKPDPKYSLKPVATRLGNLLRKAVQFGPDCVGPEVEKMVSDLPPGGVLMLENLRFHAEEEKNDPEFAKQLAKLCDVYVNDAFGAAHRADASTARIAAYMKQAAAGFLMEKELESLSYVLTRPETIRRYSGIIRQAKTIVWNGPMGVFENPKFASGTFAIARAVADSNAYSIVGGGDSAAAVAQSGVGSKITHISTGGGASLEFLSGQKLPGVEVLTDK